MIYLDNAATTFPKPEIVRVGVNKSFSYCANPGRSGHKLSIIASEKVYNCRQKLVNFLKIDSAEKVIFTPSCTYAVNTVIKGVLSKGDHVVISSLEHNCVVRPLERLQNEGFITYSIAKVEHCDDDATFESFRQAINKNTKLVICTHASNVFGVKLPISRIGALCRYYGILFCVDGAQTVGVEQINLKEMPIDYLCIPGHKGLYSVAGIGALIINCETIPRSLCEGGTGSGSHVLTQPEILPDKFESGTLNLQGIASLSEGIRFVESRGISNIKTHEMMLIKRLYSRLKKIPDVILYTPEPDDEHFVPLISFNIKNMDSETVAQILDQKYSVAVRAGLHCSPLAHRDFKTDHTGTVRVSPSVFTKPSQIDYLINSVKSLSFTKS